MGLFDNEMEIDMLIYLDADITKTKEFLSLSKEEIIQVIDLMGSFARNDEALLDYDKVGFEISSDFAEKTSKWFCYGLNDISVKNSFSWKRNNKKNVANYRERQKKKFGESVVENKVEEIQKPVKVENVKVKEVIDYSKIATIFNDTLEPFMKKSNSNFHFRFKKLSKVLAVSKKREKLVLSTFEELNKVIKFDDIYDFYTKYFMIIGQLDREGNPVNHFNTLSGWADNRDVNSKDSGWRDPDFEYIVKPATALKIFEKFM